MQTRKLYRSEKDKIFAGICGGLGEYLNVDSTVLRVIWLLIVIFSGVFPGVLAYIIGIFIIPQHPSKHTDSEPNGPQHHP